MSSSKTFLIYGPAGKFVIRCGDERINDYRGVPGYTLVPEHLAKLAPRMREVLRKLEWESIGHCPDCKKHRKDGHADWCELEPLLAEARGGGSDV